MSHDFVLARRLERAEGAANAAFVEARARLDAAAGAAWIEVAGAYAMFDGPASPMTQTFGVGMFDPFLEPEFDHVERFFAALGAPVFHEVCSLCPPATTGLLERRGYTPVERSTVLVRDTRGAALPQASGLAVREVTEAEGSLWAGIAAQGWSSESAELAAFVEQLGRVMFHARGVHCFVAEADGEPIAAAALNLSDGIALLAGASTVPAARKRGAQLALLQHRLEYAAARGYDLAMIVTQPGSASQRNAERRGFQPMYARTKWRLARA
jgi:hypothetical protein